MAVQVYTTSGIAPPSAQCIIVTWAALPNGDSGTPLELPIFADRSYQMVGTFGAGGTCLLEGSNDGTNYVTLHDPQGVALSKTAAGIFQIEELTRYIRPRVSAGDGTTAIVVTAILRGVVI